jgi:hypothetical protein
MVGKIMNYFLKRIYYAISCRSKWLIVALFPPIVFLFMSSITPDRFLISQQMNITAEKSLEPSFIYSMVSSGAFNAFEGDKHSILKPTESRELYFLMISGSEVRIVYEGANLANGSDLVSHYYDRLQRNLASSKTAEMASITDIITMPLKTQSLRAIWRPERLTPLAQYAAISLFVVLAVMFFMEFMDPSFKSERNAARYLGVPMLGSLPNADKILHHMKEPKERIKSKQPFMEEISTTS